jgi:hypothetical protein
VPILHYGWCRDARALATSQSKLKAWYADGGGLEDGRIPQVEPYNFRLKEQIEQGRAKRYEGGHPGYMGDWFDKHAEQWCEVAVNV